MKEKKFRKDYGGPPKSSHLFLTGRSAFNVENHCPRPQLKIQSLLKHFE